jgi:cytochrome c oxidase subunit 4
MKLVDTEFHIVNYRTYIYVWIALLLLLAATVAIARGQLLAQYSVLGSLFIASVKAGLVLTFFMHLKYEPPFLKTMLFFALLALTLIIGLTFSDVWYRYGE